MLSNLPPRQKEIIIRLYGLDKKLPESIDDLLKTVIMFDKGIMYAAFAFLGGLYNVMIHYH